MVLWVLHSVEKMKNECIFKKEIGRTGDHYGQKTKLFLRPSRVGEKQNFHAAALFRPCDGTRHALFPLYGGSAGAGGSVCRTVLVHQRIRKVLSGRRLRRDHASGGCVLPSGIRTPLSRDRGGAVGVSVADVRRSPGGGSAEILLLPAQMLSRGAVSA